MRIIGKLTTQDAAERFRLYLQTKGIESSFEPDFETRDGLIAYNVWVRDEDRLKEAHLMLEEFLKNPLAPEYAPPVQAPTLEEAGIPERAVVKKSAPFATFIIALCTLLYFLSSMQEMALRKEGVPEAAFLMTPIRALLLFDLPPAFVRLEEILEKNALQGTEKLADLPQEVQEELQTIEHTPYWQGAYSWILFKLQGKDTAFIEGPLFVQIRKGEVWRLFTPALLHGGLFHILFNMIWVWVLARPIEEKIGLIKTILLTLILGITANIIQYFISGPFFLGYSGIVMGLAGFVWMRQKIAPWEGYPLNRSTILFLVFFITAMFCLQTASFFLQAFTTVAFEPNIANAAHIGGGVFGALLGRLSYFAWRPS